MGEFYGRNHTLEMRMEALAVIRAAAEEMAAPPSVHPSAGAPAGSVHTGSIHTGAVHNGAVHTGSVHTGDIHTGTRPVGKSRRWHSAPRPRAPAAASRLAVVAPLFFFPLMARYDDPENAFRMLGAQRGASLFL